MGEQTRHKTSYRFLPKTTTRKDTLLAGHLWLLLPAGIGGAISFTLGLAAGWQAAANAVAATSGIIVGALALRAVALMYLERRRLTRESTELLELYHSTLRCLGAAIDARDSYSYEHVAAVEQVACLIAREMNIGPSEQQGIHTAALLIDVGKLAIPENILLQPGRPNAEEFAAIHNHPIIGSQILDTVRFPWAVGKMIRSHHEQWDGSGYPDRLSGEEIPQGARILAVADVYAALTCNRAYRAGWTHHRAVEHIREHSGTQFDPQVVSAFLGVESQITQRASQSAPAPADRASAAISWANQKFVALWDISRLANASLDLQDTLDITAKKVCDVLGGHAAAVFLHDRDSGDLICRAVCPAVPGMLGSHAAHSPAGTARVAETRRAAIVRTVSDSICKSDGEQVRAAYQWEAVAALRIGTEVLGTINVYRLNRDFAIEELDLLDAMARHAALPVAHASLFEETRATAHRDPLTQLHNLRYFCSKMERELARAQRLGHTCSIVAIDLDHFKAVNDTLGHNAGDTVLRDMARLFAGKVREYDCVVRYGGDEFVIVLPEATRVEAEETIARLRSAVSSYCKGVESLMALRFGASFGYAVFPDDGGDAKSLLEVADRRMYSDKRARNASREAA